jgi:hypothetical protein
VLGQLRVAGVGEHRSKLLRQADAIVELSQRLQAGVGRIDLDGQMGNDSKKSKWKRETDGGIFSEASLAMNPHLLFNPFGEGRGEFYRIR